MKFSGGWLLLLGCCVISFALFGGVGTRKGMQSVGSLMFLNPPAWAKDTVLPYADTVSPAEKNPEEMRKTLPAFSYANVRDYIFAALSYPAAAIEKEIEGEVYVHFRIDTLGWVEDVGVVKQVHPLLDSAALRLIRDMPRWRPVIRFGRPVPVEFIVPVIFKLKEP